MEEYLKFITQKTKQLEKKDGLLIVTSKEDLPWETFTIDDFPLKYKEVKEVVVTDLKILGPWKDVFSILLKKLDFRLLLLLSVCCKDFMKLVKIEITRREKVLLDGMDFFSDKTCWFLGRICQGTTAKIEYVIKDGEYIQEDHLLVRKCKQYEELTTIGDHGICKECYKLKKSVEGQFQRELADRYKKQEDRKEWKQRQKVYQESQIEVQANMHIRHTNLSKGIIGVTGEKSHIHVGKRPTFRTKNSNDI
jgi:hypothetical protein